MDVFEAIRKRASVRNLRAVDIPDDDLDRILDAGRRAASGMNKQPLDFIVIRDADIIGELAGAQSCIGDVNTVIAIVGKPDKSKYWLEDIAAATENMLLAITALGYATVWIEGTLLRAEDKWKQLLEVPEAMRLMVALPIGQAAREPRQAGKRPLSDMVHHDRYGQRG